MIAYILLLLNSIPRKNTQEINTGWCNSIRTRPMHGVNHGVLHLWELTTFFNGQWTVGQRKTCWAPSRDVLLYLNEPQPSSLLLITCSDDALQTHAFRCPGLTYCNRPSEGPSFWLDYPGWVWVFRILGRMCFSGASVPGGQSGPPRTGELATARLAASSRVEGALHPQFRDKHREGNQ